MKKVIAVLADDKEIILREKCAKIAEFSKRFNERREFLEKQKKALSADMSREKKEFWDDIKKYLADNNRMPEGFDPEHHGFNYDGDLGLLIYDSDPKSSLSGLGAWLAELME